MTGLQCWAHRHRELVPIEVHHVWPKGEGGPDVKDNKVPVCANAHSSTHALLNQMLHADTEKLPWTVRRQYGRKVRRLAVAGFRAIKTRAVVAP